MSYYRPEIDGLRAIAIIPVVLFHAGFLGFFGGGYVGVDIFFVISGFLITSILLKEMVRGTFSFFNFWERRIRRIFPALLAMLFVTLLVAYICVLYLNDLGDFGKSLFSQGLFLSNIFFMRRQGYFADPSESSLLLHTWTLSVEERFYILLQLLLVGVWTFFRKKLFLFFLTIGTLSFALNTYLVYIVPGNNFMIPFTPDI